MLYVLDTLGSILFTSKPFKNTLKTEPTLSRAEQCSRFVVLVAVTVSEYCTENEPFISAVHTSSKVDCVASKYNHQTKVSPV